MILRPYQIEAIDRIRSAMRQGSRSVCAVGATGCGKCLAIGTLVIRSDGRLARVEDVAVGDTLLGPDSTVRRVLSTTRGRGPMYRVTPTKGEPWVCNDVHVLTLVHTETGAVVDIDLPSYLARSAYWRHCHKQFTPPAGVDFDTPGDVPIDPYFLGVWFGDGTKCLSSVAVSKPDPEILTLMQDIAAAYGMRVRTDDGGRCPTHSIVNARGAGNRLLTEMRTVVGDARTVPLAYLTASREARASFLAGIIDTDGHVYRGCVEITQRERGIVDGVAFIARSLGFCATIAAKVVDGTTYWRMILSGDFAALPMRIERKRMTARTQKKCATRTGITVEPISEGEYAGFELDGDGRFLLGDFTVTHNTSVAAEIARRAALAGQHVLWLAHRRELIEQGARTLEAFGLEPGVVAAGSGERRCRPFARVQVASIQTLLKRNERPRADVVIWDEAHHAPSDEWSGLASAYAHAWLIGFTATPERSDGRGLGAIYTRLVVIARIRDMVAGGFLVPCGVIAPKAKLAAGSIARRPVEAWKDHAPGKRTLVFSPSIVAAEKHAAEFTDAGIPTRIVHGKTPPLERTQALIDYEAGRVRVLVNVYVMTEGTDLPATECIILARGCGTAGTYLQIVGRGLRVAPGKTSCLLIDLHGVSHVHGHPEDDRIFSLDGRGIRRDVDLPVEDGVTFCRVCGALLDSTAEACAECGTEGKTQAAPRVTGEALVKYARKRAEPPEERAKTLGRWIREGRANEYKPGWASWKFKSVYGTWPAGDIKAAALAIADAVVEDDDRGAA